jgi:diguanylate cyclase (GGDEF)-like protein
MGLAWPLQVIVVTVWLLVPHPHGAHPVLLALITLAALPLYLPLLIIRRPVLTRKAANISMVLGVAQMGAMVWAGGGLASGFELMPLWFVPVTVCLVPALDVVVELLVVFAGAGLAAFLSARAGAVTTEASMWGFGVMAAATLIVTTAATGFVYSELRTLSERFRRRSVQDPLTDLANRSGILTFSGRTPSDVSGGAAYVIDVDGFKFINDSLGHQAGDALLRQLADRLRSHARAEDFLARTGGDEFVLIVRNVSDGEAALALGDRLLGVCDEPFGLDGLEAQMSVTVGVALLADADSIEEALSNADLALYAAKSEQRGTVRVFQVAMRARVASQLSTEHHLRRALEGDELRVVYQPIVSLQTGSVAAMEALLRWRSADLGDVSPVEFIPVAERTGLILPIGRFVLTQAVQQLARWHDQGHHDVTVSVNLSAAQLADAQLPDLIGDLLDRYAVPPSRLCLELTESILMERVTGRPLAMLDRLRATGVQLALDDFGTGYSSLARLTQLDMNALKIDRSFIARLLADPTADAVVGAILRVAESMGIAVVSEGIETAEQLERLSELGCQYGQGYLFERPLEADSAELLLSRDLDIRASS